MATKNTSAVHFDFVPPSPVKSKRSLKLCQKGKDFWTYEFPDNPEVVAVVELAQYDDQNNREWIETIFGITGDGSIVLCSDLDEREALNLNPNGNVRVSREDYP